MQLTRRDLLKLGLGTAAAAALSPRSPLFALSPARSSAVITRPIPSSGERLPVVGIGTARRYTRPSPEDRAEIKAVLQKFPDLGGSVVDTAPSYGNAEEVVGELVSELGNRPRLFLATKVSARGKSAGREQIEQSFKLLRTDRIDLIAVHNLVDTEDHLATLRDLQQARRIRYVGITTSSDRQYADMEAVMKAQKLDFIQVDYAVDNRNAGERLLPLAADRGMAVMVNLPLGRGQLFPALASRPLPDWTKEFDCQSWAQFFLKYIVSHPAVTCAIPGTARVRYVDDNLQAARGRLPDAAMRQRMEAFIDSVKI